MRRWLIGLVFFLVLGSVAFGEMQIYFAPDGGWAPENKQRIIRYSDGTSGRATLANAVRDLILRTPDRGTIKIAMYAFSDRSIQDLLIQAAFTRDVTVKVILDGVADWTLDMRREFQARVEEARKTAPSYQRDNFHLKVIGKKGFASKGRTRKLDSGEVIFGTMHEKFGVFYEPGVRVPLHAFAGSSNLSFGSDQLFSENRVVFLNEPAVARQFAEEFARLWNEYGEDVLGSTTSEKYVNADSVVGGVQVVFNGEPVDEESQYRIDQVLLDSLGKVHWKEGTIDIMMFSFTHFQLAQKLLEIAQRYPKVQIRLLMDQSQLIADEDHRGILGPYLEEEIRKLGIQNFSIRYKWRSNILFWEPDVVAAQDEGRAAEEEAGKADPNLDGVPAAVSAPQGEPPSAKIAPIHWRSLILHHKVLMVNRRILVMGSYNWSSSAERRNLEQAMVFNAAYPGHKDIVDRMGLEFDFLWNSEYRAGPFSAKVETPQVLDGPRGRALAKNIVKTLQRRGMRPVMEAIDAGRGKPVLLSEIKVKSGLSAREVRRCLKQLADIGLIFRKGDGAEEAYGLAD